MEKTPSKKATNAPKKACGMICKKITESYYSCIYKVINQVHPDTGIINKLMSIINSFINDIFGRITGMAVKISTYNNKATLLLW